MIYTAQIMAAANLAHANVLIDRNTDWVGEFISPVHDLFKWPDNQSFEEPYSGWRNSVYAHCQERHYSASDSLGKNDSLFHSVLLIFNVYSNFSIVNEPFFSGGAGALHPVNATTWFAIDTASLLTFRAMNSCRWHIEKKSAIESLFSVRDRIEVLEFLDEHPFLSRILREARHHLERYFPILDLVLEVICDPEAEDDKQLVLSVVSELNPTESLERLGQFDREWWLDAMHGVQNKLCINLEFR
jgi:hypothetical protein